MNLVFLWFGGFLFFVFNTPGHSVEYIISDKGIGTVGLFQKAPTSTCTVEDMKKKHG